MATSLSDEPADTSSGRWRDTADPDTAIRADEAYAEEVSLRGPEGQRIITSTYVPRGEPIGGLVICSPLHAEFLHNYRKEVVLARELASAGVAVQRFQYRGTGNSEGATDSITFESMLDDTLTALALFRERVSTTTLAFLGTRVGGTVAAAAAAGFDRSALVLWQPVLDAESYFRELFRAASIRELRRDARAEGSGRPRSSRATIRDLETTGEVDVLGYSVHRTLYSSLLEHPLRGELDDRPRDILLLQLDRAERLAGPYEETVDDLRSSGFGVRARAIQADEHWWFSGNPDHASSTLKTVVTETTHWLLDRFGGS